MSDGKTTTNQQQTTGTDLQSLGLRSYSEFAKCSCGATGFTSVENKCNVGNFIFCCCFNQCWCCYQVVKHKDLNCYDADHKCSACNKNLAHYTAC